MKKKFSISVKGTLVTLVPLAVIGLVSILSFSTVVNNIIKSNCREKATTQAELAASAVMDMFRAPLASLEDIAMVTGDNQDFDMIKNLLVKIASQYSAASYYWTTITPLPQGGTLIMSYDWAPPDDSWDQSTRPWYIGAKNANGEMYCYIYLNVRTNAYCISFTKAIYNSKGQMSAIAGFDIGLGGLTEAIKGIQISENNTLCVIDGEGHYITNDNPSLIMSEKEKFFDPLNLSFEEADETYFSGGDAYIDSARYYVAKAIGSTPLYITAYGPLSDFTGTLQRSIIIISLVLVVIIVIAIIISTAYVNSVQAKAGALGEAGSRMAETTQETASSISSIIGAIDDMHAHISNQSASVEETAGAVNQIASNIESLNRMIETQSAGVTQASSAVEEMVGNINSVNGSVDKMAQSFEGLEAQARNGVAKQGSVNEKIKQIESQSQMLQEANSAIANIASQTNLLAMNAAIEAAHAGDAGRGFSVVAEEIRKLSETSSAQSKTIREELKTIESSINAVVGMSAESSSAFAGVASEIQSTDELVRQIKAAMEEQRAGSAQIIDALKDMNDSTEEVRSSAAEMSEGNKAILDEIRRLQDATSAMKDGMNEMAQGAQKISENGDVLDGVSETMKGVISKIGEQIDRFSA